LWPVKLLISVISASLVDIAIALVAFSDGSLVSLGAIASDAPATVSDAGSDGQRRSATLKVAGSDKKGRSATLEPKLYRCECGFQTKNRYEYSGHARTCEMHKASVSKAKSEKLIPVELPARSQ